MLFYVSEGVLHTNSSYFDKTRGNQFRENISGAFNEGVINQDFNDALAYALQQERHFYHSFFKDANDYNTFIRKLRELFEKAGNDGERIRGLSNAKISEGKYIPSQSVSMPVEYQLIITGDISQELTFDALNSEITSVTGGPIFITINKDSFNLAKQILNTVEGYKRFNESKPDLTKTRDWLAKAIGDKASQEIGKNIVAVKKDPGFKSIEAKQSTRFIAGGFPFKWKKSEIEALLKGENGPEAKAQLEKQMKAALIEIKSFIFNDCLKVNDGTLYDGVNVLRQAAEDTWASVVGDGPLITQNFFFEGKNLTKSVLGNGGEFQAALIDRYVHLALGHTNPSLGNIIGGIIKDGRGQPRSDYQLVLELGGDIGTIILGMQVKNVNEETMKNLEINTDLGLVAPNLDTSFTDTIANSYFNTDIKSMFSNMEGFLKTYLETYFWKAMNLNVGKGLDPHHTNTFYWVGGTTLVPASKIIETMKSNTAVSSPVFKITGPSYASYSDEEFLNNTGDDPRFVDYWYGNQYLGWTPTPTNFKLYSKLLSSTRISTSFNMPAILNANGGMNNFEFLGQNL